METMNQQCQTMMRRYRGKNKERQDKQPKKLWAPIEVTAIAEYVVKCNGKIVPRNSFIKNLMDYYKWNDLSFIQVANKWDTIHKSYVIACGWRRENGHGILDAFGDRVLHDMLIERCPQFDILESVLGRRDPSQILIEYEMADHSSDHSGDRSCDNIEIGDEREGQFEGSISENDIGVESIHKKFRIDSTEATADTTDPNQSFMRNDQDRIALTYERRAVIEEQKLALLREEFQLKKEEFLRKKLLDEKNNQLRSLEIEKEQKIECNKYMLEVAKLSGDPELLKLLVMDCVNSLKDEN